MYPSHAHPGEARYPAGPEFSSVRMPMDHAGAMSRYPYPGQYGGPRGMMSSPYGSKPPGASDGMYPQGWSPSSMNYVHKPSGPYPMQVCSLFTCAMCLCVYIIHCMIMFDSGDHLVLDLLNN